MRESPFERAVMLAPLLFIILLVFACNLSAPRRRDPPLWLTGSLQEIHDGKILFNPPREMDQGKTERIEARISYLDLDDAITRGLKGRGEPNLEAIQVGEIMTVTLHADTKEFDIKKYSSDEQVVAGRPYAQWEWDVTPLEYGELTLHLKAVINLVDIDKQKAAYDIPVIDRAITVKVNPPYIATQAALDKQNWTIFFGSGFGVLIITTIVTAIKLARRKRRTTVVRGFHSPKK